VAFYLKIQAIPAFAAGDVLIQIQGIRRGSLPPKRENPFISEEVYKEVLLWGNACAGTEH